MTNRNRQRGDYLERCTKKALEADGWAATRSAGSHGPWDVMALHKRHVPILVACKTNGTMSPAERRALVEAAHSVGASALLAARPRRGWVHLYRVHPEGVGQLVTALQIPAPVPKTRET